MSDIKTVALRVEQTIVIQVPERYTRPHDMDVLDSTASLLLGGRKDRAEKVRRLLQCENKYDYDQQLKYFKQAYDMASEIHGHYEKYSCVPHISI